MMRTYSLLTICLALPGLALAGNIVQDPGFESATLTPWVSGGHPWGVDTANGHSGSNSAGTGCAGSDCIASDPDPRGAWIYQDLATTPGTSYVLSFWIGLRGTTGGTTPNELKVLWNGGEVFDVQNLITTPFQQYFVNVVATGGTTRLEFVGRNDPNVIDLDDVGVDGGSIPRSGVPEPAGWMLAASGVAGVAFGRRRGRAKC